MFVLIVVEEEFDETIVPKQSASVPTSGAHVTYFSAQTSTVPKAPNTKSKGKSTKYKSDGKFQSRRK